MVRLGGPPAAGRLRRGRADRRLRGHGRGGSRDLDHHRGGLPEGPVGAGADRNPDEEAEAERHRRHRHRPAAVDDRQRRPPHRSEAQGRVAVGSDRARDQPPGKPHRRTPSAGDPEGPLVEGRGRGGPVGGWIGTPRRGSAWVVAGSALRGLDRLVAAGSCDVAAGSATLRPDRATLRPARPGWRPARLVAPAWRRWRPAWRRWRPARTRRRAPSRFLSARISPRAPIEPGSPARPGAPAQGRARRRSASSRRRREPGGLRTPGRSRSSPRGPRRAPARRPRAARQRPAGRRRGSSGGRGGSGRGSPSRRRGPRGPIGARRSAARARRGDGSARGPDARRTARRGRCLLRPAARPLCLAATGLARNRVRLGGGGWAGGRGSGRGGPCPAASLAARRLPGHRRVALLRRGRRVEPGACPDAGTDAAGEARPRSEAQSPSPPRPAAPADGS